MDFRSTPLRFRIVLGFFGLLSVFLVARFAYVMLLNSQVAISSQIAMPAVERGPILDRNGKILAIQTRLNSVSAWIPNVTRPEETARLLGSALGIEEAKLLDKLKSSSGFVFIKRKISPTENSRVQALIDEGKLDGISLQPEFARNYPNKSLASHLIGYVGTDNIGLDGLEYTFNQELSPPVVGEDVDMVYGNQVFLTIDLSIQYALEKIGDETLKKSKADSIMIIAMEAKTGDILGYASLPNYDPNIVSTLNAKTMKNKPISLMYEPGSVFKVFSIASMLDRGRIGPKDLFLCQGHYETKYGDGKTITIGCLGTHGYVSPETILKYSCNAGAAYASERIPADEFHDMLRLFGFGAPTGIPLNGEEAGFLRAPRDWSIRSKPTIAIGQEISVTALQIMKAATAFANDGTILEPHVVKRIVAPDGTPIHTYARVPVKQVISAQTARNILNYMESVTGEGGTATRAVIPGLRVSAKTGTSQTADPKTGKYSDTAYVASCLALFPTEDPQIILYVVIESPMGDSYYGGRVAAPVVKEVGDFLAPYLGIPRTGEKVVTHSGKVKVTRTDAPEVKDVIPDFTGVPKRSLLPLLGRKDLKISIQGSGWVYRQNPPPGTPFVQGMSLVLELR